MVYSKCNKILIVKLTSNDLFSTKICTQKLDGVWIGIMFVWLCATDTDTITGIHIHILNRPYYSHSYAVVVFVTNALSLLKPFNESESSGIPWEYVCQAIIIIVALCVLCVVCSGLFRVWYNCARSKWKGIWSEQSSTLSFSARGRASLI